LEIKKNNEKFEDNNLNNDSKNISDEKEK